jgi:hypothetical protein
VVREQVAYDPTRDFALEDFLTNSVYARTFGRIETDRGDRWFFEGRLQNHVTLRDLNPAASLDPHVEGWADVGLGETGWSGRLGDAADLRVGALIEPWGRLNVLSVADVLNPRDLREGLLTPPELVKIPVPMAVLGVGSKALRAETVLVPFAFHDQLFLRETNWSPVRQGWAPDLLFRMEDWLPPDSDQTLTAQEVLDNLHDLAIDPDPSTRRALDQAVLGNQLPQAFWGNGELAERIELTGPNAMVAVMGGSLRATEPATRLNRALVDVLRTRTLPDTSDPNAILDLQDRVLGDIVTVDWPRTWVAGADGSVLAGPVQVSAEALWTQRSIVRLPYLRARTVPSLGVGLGLLYLRGSSLAVTVEGRYVHLFDAPVHPLVTRRPRPGRGDRPVDRAAEPADAPGRRPVRPDVRRACRRRAGRDVPGDRPPAARARRGGADRVEPRADRAAGQLGGRADLHRRPGLVHPRQRRGHAGRPAREVGGHMRVRGLVVAALATGCGSKGGADLRLTDANDYTIDASSLTLGHFPVEAQADATLDWSGLTADLRGRALDPTTVDQVAVTNLQMTEDELTERVLANAIAQSDIHDPATFGNADHGTSVALSQLDSVGNPFDLQALVGGADHTWVASLVDVEDAGQQQVLYTVILDVGATGGTVAFADGASSVSVVPNLHDPALIEATAGRDGYTLDWSDLTADTFGNPIDGKTFPGFTADGTWLVGLVDRASLSPLPLVMAVVGVSAG